MRHRLRRGTRSATSRSQPAPARIISLVPAVSEMLFAIGAGPQVVAVSSFDDYPPEVLKLPRVGALLDPDLERILSLRPDLVIVYESQADLRRQLERASIPMFVYKHAALADVTVTIRQLGTRVGRDEGATTSTGLIDAKLAEIRTSGCRPAPPEDVAGLRPRRARAARHLRQRRLRLPARHARRPPAATTSSPT